MVSDGLWLIDAAACLILNSPQSILRVGGKRAS